MTLDDIYNAVRSIESLQPDWLYETSDGTLNTEPYKIFFLKETADGLVSGSIMATESMASLDLRLYLGCTLKNVPSDPYEFRYDPHVNAPNGYVTLGADSFFQRKGFFGPKTTPEIKYLKKYLDHIATPLFSAARRAGYERHLQQTAQHQATEQKFRRKYLGRG